MGLLWAIEFGEQLNEDLQDGKLDRREAFALIPIVWKAPTLIRKRLDMMREWPIVVNDETKRQELIKYIASELDINDDNAERKILAGVKLALAIGLFIKEIKE